MRSKIKNKQGFSSLIADVDNLTVVIYGDIKSKPSSVRRYKFLLQNLEQKNIALYSNGSSKEDIKKSVLETIAVFADGFQFHPADVDTVYWLVSLSILCNVELEDFKRITKIIERDKVQDKLLDYIIKYKQTDWQGDSQKIICSHPYQHLSKIIDTTDEEQGIKLLQDYLKNKWYQEHDENDAPWVDSHKNTKVNTYFGYWAWETAALVKAKGWDDEKLKDMDYYPYDAVHW